MLLFGVPAPCLRVLPYPYAKTCPRESTYFDRKRETMRKALIIGVIGVLGILGLQSCNVTRTITTRSEYWQKADTSVVIQTKTIETYDASKKL
jgi:hypothetical protein